MEVSTRTLDKISCRALLLLKLGEYIRNDNPDQSKKYLKEC